MSSFNKSDGGMFRTAYELSAGMLSFPIAIALGWWFGRTLDVWFGTSPWMMRVFIVLGVVAGVLNVFRTLSRVLRQNRADHPRG